MKASSLVSVPVHAGAALRHRRLFHPVGVLAHGSIERLAAPGDGLPMESAAVVARLSKGIGSPGALPDFAGLAWRMPPAPFAATPWDVLLVSAGFGPSSLIVNRTLLRPVTTWSQAPYSSLMPLRHRGGLYWLRARLTDPMDRGGLSLEVVREHIGGDGLHFDIEQACGTADFSPLARLSITEVVSGSEHRDGDVAFDPVRHTAPDVTLWPEWLREVRETAYRSSREGRAG